MVSNDSAEYNRVLDAIMEARRSIRTFKPESPPKELIEQVIRGSLLAPYSELALSGNGYRRFVVIPRDSKTTVRVAEIMKRRIVALNEQFDKQMKEDPFLQQHGQAFACRLKTMSEHVCPALAKPTTTSWSQSGKGSIR